MNYDNTCNKKYEYYPVSLSQKGIYLKNSSNSSEFNIVFCARLVGKLNKEKFIAAFDEMVERHDAFHTSFSFCNNELVQRINERQAIPMPYFELTEGQSYSEILASLNSPFDLNKPPLARSALIKHQDNEYTFVLIMHHIISDGESLNIILHEIKDLYNGKELKSLSFQYKDYSIWNHERLANGELDFQQEFWVKMFSSPPQKLNLFAENLSNLKAKGSGVSVTIPKEMTAQLNHIIKQYMRIYSLTLNTLLFSIYDILLYKYTGQADKVIGTISAGRNHKGLSNIVGTFINLLPIRINTDSNDSFINHVQYVSEVFSGAYINQEFPFERILDKVSSTSEKNGFSSLIQTMFVYHGAEKENKIVFNNSLEMKILNHNIQKVTFGIHVDIFRTKEDALIVNFGFNEIMLSKINMNKFAEHFINLCKIIISNPEIAIKDIYIYSDSEKMYLNNLICSDINYPCNKTIIDYFYDMVNNQPNEIAVVHNEGSYTYEELNEMSNKIAHILLSYGVTANTLVGISIKKNPLLVPGILGILKAGGGYVPIDTKWPQDRVSRIIEDSNAVLVVDTGDEAINSYVYKVKTIFLSDIVNDAAIPTTNHVYNLDIERIVYVIYTSGSTGQSKGVAVKLNSFSNLVKWYVNEYKMNEKDRNLLFAPLSFDLSQKNIYAPLISGGQLNLYCEEDLNYMLLSEIINNNKITIVNCAPAVFYPLIEINQTNNYYNLQNLRFAFLGGEDINLKKLKNWQLSERCTCTIVNTFGPTECTDISNSYCITPEDIANEIKVPIGKPIYNVEVYIMDNDRNIVPIGIEGEIFIGGIGVSKGYINDNQLNREKFILWNNKTLYKTGDRGYWDEKGNIVFLGRIDYQVKIRGNRIELCEIENVIRNFEEIKEVVVTAINNDDGDKDLCAYIVINEGQAISWTQLYKRIRDFLPEYMVPTLYVELPKLPLNSHGKIDRSKFPKHREDFFYTKETYTEPENKIEKLLQEMWGKILKIEKLSTTENLINAGANSLKFAIAITEIQKEFSVKIPISIIFHNPTIKAISDYIKIENSKKETNEIRDDIIFDF